MQGTRPSSPVVLVNGLVVLPDRVESECAVYIADGKIQAVDDAGAMPDSVPRVDVRGRYVTPGLIDIHIHGASGANFNDATEDAFARILDTCGKAGVTGVLATTATAPMPQLLDALAMTANWMASPRRGAQLLGAHVEGPYFASSQAGAQDPASLRMPSDGEFERLLAWHEVIRIFTYAPELPGAEAITQRVNELGIVPAAGHSAAREEDIVPHFALGLRHMIHIWSAQSTTVREGPWRKPGMLEVSLTAENLTVEMIGDGKHLPPTLMRLAYRAIGPDRLCLISDATSGAGLAEGAHFRMGEMEYVVGSGVGMLLDFSAFAGSTTLLNQVVRTVMEQVGVPLAEVVRMATLTPARVIGVDGHKGSLAAGKDADIVVFEKDFSPAWVMVGGQWISPVPA